MNLIISGFADEISSNLDEQIETLNNLNLNHLCLRSVDGLNIGEYTEDRFSKEVLPRIKEAKLKVSSIGSPIGKVFIDDEEGFEKQKKQLEEIAKIANSLDTKYIRIFSFYIDKNENYDSYKDEVILKLKEFINIAKKYNVVLLHENEKDIFGDTSKRVHTLMEELGGENFKSIFDFANYVQVNENPLEAWDRLESFVEYIHIKDAKYDSNENVVCGTGDGKIREILEIAINKGYKGFLTMEPHLVLFDALKDLELENPEDIIKDNKNMTGSQAYETQLNALITILNEIEGGK